MDMDWSQSIDKAWIELFKKYYCKKIKKEMWYFLRCPDESCEMWSEKICNWAKTNGFTLKDQYFYNLMDVEILCPGLWQ